MNSFCLTTFSLNYFEVRVSFFLVFSSRGLSVTFDIQIDLKIKHSEPCQLSKMEIFAKIVNGFNFWLFLKKLHFKCLARFCVCLWSQERLAEKVSSQMFDSVLHSPLETIIFAKVFANYLLNSKIYRVPSISHGIVGFWFLLHFSLLRHFFENRG